MAAGKAKDVSAIHSIADNETAGFIFRDDPIEIRSAGTRAEQVIKD